jgi:tetratricopeptide (TPR) repeat protein
VLAASVAAALALGTPPRLAHADPLGDLEKAHSAYVAHKYDEAETRLRALLDAKTGLLKDADNVADARMYLGAVLVAEGKKDDASRVFEQLLLEKPDYEPDPLRVSLGSIDVFVDARSRLRDRLAALQAERVRKVQDERAKIEAERQKAAVRLAMLEKLATEEVVIEKNSRWLALVPFGAGQFQNGQDVPGAVFLTGEVALGLGSIIGAAITLYDAGQARASVAGGDDPSARDYQKQAQLAAIVGDTFSAGFFLTAAAGIIHAEATFVPERTYVRARPLPPVSVSPFVAPTGVGITGRF